MKKKGIIFICLFCLLSHGFAQKTGTWKSFMAYHNTTGVVETPKNVFAIADGSLYRYGKEDNSIQLYDRITGLSDIEIGLIDYNSTINKLLIVYSGSGSEGNIDILSDDGIYNLPFLMNDMSIPDKKINAIYFHDIYAYLATNFGVMVVNMNKQEITETYKLNKNVLSVCIYNNHLFAATENGLFSGSLESNLLDKNNWNLYPYPDANVMNKPDAIQQICVFQDVLCFHIKGGIYYQEPDGTLKTLYKNTSLKNMKLLGNNQLVAYTSDKAYIYYSLNEHFTLNTGTLFDISSLKDDNTYWIAAGTDMLKGIRKKEDKYEWILSDIVINSPKRNLTHFFTVQNDKLYVVGGGRGTNRFNNPPTLMVYENNEWYNLNDSLFRPSNLNTKDLTSIAIDPKDPNHYYVTSYGEGLFEIKDNEFIQLFNAENSLLNASVANNPTHYTRLSGIAFDEENNLWITNNEVSNPISVIKADGTWETYEFEELNVEYCNTDKISVIKGNKWVNFVVGKVTGVFVFNEKTNNHQLYTDMVDSQGNSLAIGVTHCVVEDKSGVVWIGSNNGLIKVPNPSKVFENDKLHYSRLIYLGENGYYYFLDGVRINTIAVDAANRKWIGTEGHGIYVLNEDGSETVETFNTKNSRLMSDNIQCLTINEKTGEVFIGVGSTSNNARILSYMSGVTEGKEDYSNVTVYPNPVRPDYVDQVVISGLMDNSNVKITDINGNLIIQGKSLGGQFTWNCHNSKGDKVSTGVYLVLSSTPEAKESVVTKIAVVR